MPQSRKLVVGLTPPFPLDGGTAIQVYSVNLIAVNEGKMKAHFESVMNAN